MKVIKTTQILVEQLVSRPSPINHQWAMKCSQSTNHANYPDCYMIYLAIFNDIHVQFNKTKSHRNSKSGIFVIVWWVESCGDADWNVLGPSACFLARSPWTGPWFRQRPLTLFSHTFSKIKSVLCFKCFKNKKRLEVQRVSYIRAEGLKVFSVVEGLRVVDHVFPKV